MKRILTLAAIAATGSSAPAIAAEKAANQAATPVTAQLAFKANADQVRKLLHARDYTAVSQLHRDESGRWNGTAVKDGKRTFISVRLPSKLKQPLTN